MCLDVPGWASDVRGAAPTAEISVPGWVTASSLEMLTSDYSCLQSSAGVIYHVPSECLIMLERASRVGRVV